MSAPRLPGYPVIDDPTHPLWEEQESCWPNHTAAEAMREAVELRKPGFVNSASHPAYAAGYTRNEYAERPEESRPPSPKARR
jgi:hypothetical protein